MMRARGRARGRGQRGPPAQQDPAQRRPGTTVQCDARQQQQQQAQGQSGPGGDPRVGLPGPSHGRAWANTGGQPGQTGPSVGEQAAKQGAPFGRDPINTSPAAAAAGGVGTEPVEQAMAAMTLTPRGIGKEMGASVRTTSRGRRRGVDEYRTTVTRPQDAVKQGTMGTGELVQKLISNHAMVRWRESQTWYQYHVEFQPEVELRSWRNRLLAAHKDTVLDSGYVFNGMTLFMRQKLQEKCTELFSEHPQDKSPVKIIIDLRTELPDTSPEAIHLANLALKTVFRGEEWMLIGRNYYNMNWKWSAPQSKWLEIVSGFSTSILPFEEGLQLQVDISHKVIQTVSVLDIMNDVHSRCPPSQLKDRLYKMLVGSVVITRYNQKTYRVNDIRFDLTPATYTFKSRDGEMTVAQYFNKAYGCLDLNTEQPLLSMVVAKKQQRQGVKEILIPPSLLLMTGISDEIRNNYHLMKPISDHMKTAPLPRYQQLSQFVKGLSQPGAADGPSQGLAQRGLQVASKLLEVEGRLLPSTVYMKCAELEVGPTADWSTSMRGKDIQASVTIDRWIFVFPDKLQQLALSFCGILKEVCRSAGITLREPHSVVLENSRTGNYVSTIRQLVSTHDLQMALVVLPDKGDRTTYEAVKKLTCLHNPVPSQCLRERTLRKMNKSIATKLGLQMQCKLGGELWRVKIPKMKDFMVVGIDTYHDTVTRGQSVMGLVASLNQAVTQYVSHTTQQGAGAELGNHLSVMITKALRSYYRRNRGLPSRVIVYRDGVGDGMLDLVVSHEQPQIRQELDLLETQHGVKIELIFIVVKKGIHNRFFLKTADGRVTNPLPGTVIDKTVTRPEWFDFYLVSQSVRQGTVSPTHYNVILNESRAVWGPNHLQKFTYWLTHLYYNWQGTIRVPAPCQYAHKIAYQVGQYLHKSADQCLEETLWYL